MSGATQYGTDEPVGSSGGMSGVMTSSRLTAA